MMITKVESAADVGARENGMDWMPGLVNDALQLMEWIGCQEWRLIMMEDV